MIRTFRRWWQEPDHYHYMTALMAARGGQRLACRRFAIGTLGFGFLAFVMLWSPAGPTGTVNRSIAAAGILVTALAALGWLRSRWPTRTQSLAFLVLMALCTMVAALTQSNPVSGFVASMSFAGICGYAVFLHSSRYVFLVLAAVAVTVGVLMVRLSMRDELVWALCLAASVVVVVVPVGALCQGFVKLLKIDVGHLDIEPLTGLLNRHALYSATSGVMGARDRWHDQVLLLIVVGVDSLSALSSLRGRAASDRARVAAARTLRETTRTGAALGHVSDSEFVVVDSGFSADWQPLTERIRLSIKQTPPRTSVSIGVVTIPMPGLSVQPLHDLVDELIDIATTAMQDARRLGGNRVCHRALSELPVLDETRSDSLQ